MSINKEESEKLINKINIGMELSIGYLHEHQLPNGEFMSYYAPDDEMKLWCVPDSIVFFTALIGTCLIPLKHLPKVNDILASSEIFLKNQMMRGGVWNYFTKWNALFKYSPADIDDTVFASNVLRSLKSNFVDNTTALLANRNAKGLFYTWFIIRYPAAYNKNYFQIIIRELKRPFHSLLFWFKHQGSRNDIDAAVNANVLNYLGLDANTKPIVDFLVDLIIKNKELTADKWYKNPITLYYFISRNYKSAKELEQIKGPIVERICSLGNDNGGFGNSDMETALAVSALLNFNHIDERVLSAVGFLLKSQKKAGNWARNIFFYAGPNKIVGWGSEELTTAYCLEALFNYQTILKNSI